MASIWNKLIGQGKGILSRGRNPVRNTAVRIMESGEKARRNHKYVYEEPDMAALLNQRAVWERIAKGAKPSEALGAAFSVLKTKRIPRFSVLVMTYEPVLKYLEGTLISILSQTYGGFEVIVADTSMSDSVKELLDHYRDERIRYYNVPGNHGEASLFNDAAHFADGDYLCRVDVGDFLAKDALYEMFLHILKTNAEILYSDEDRCDSACKKFYDPYFKPDFNKDYLLARNYVRRLLVIRRELFIALRYRDAFDGALDYDLVLRAPKSGICHVAKVLYHVSEASAIANEAAKERGAEVSAGRAALEDYLSVRGIHATVAYSKRRGIYRIGYLPDIFTCRSDVGIVGGKILSRSHKIIGGMYDSTGRVMFEGMDEAEGGAQNRALSVQNAFAVDVRCMKIRPELEQMYERVFGVPYREQSFDGEENPAELKRKSILMCRMARELGYLVVWDPFIIQIF